MANLTLENNKIVSILSGNSFSEILQKMWWCGKDNEGRWKAAWACQRLGLGPGQVDRREHLAEQTENKRKTPGKEISSESARLDTATLGVSGHPDLSRVRAF